MITDKEKDEIFETLVVFYSSISYNKSNLIYTFKRAYETNEDFIKILYSENTRTFFRRIIRLQNADFVKHISNEFELYCIYNRVTLEDKKRWLNHTYNFIVPIKGLSGFINKSTVVDFVVWFKETISRITTEQPPQAEIVKYDEVKKELHNHIFKHNAFEIFESYKEKKQISAQSRTDLRVIFDLLKNDGLLSDTIELKHYINWINKEYFNNDVIELRVQNLKSKPNIIRANDYEDIKSITLKQP